MHDQPKVKQEETEEEKKFHREDEQRKGEAYRSQMASYRAKNYSVDALHSNRKMLLDIPEAYSFYNYRREILQHLFTHAADDKEDDKVDKPRINRSPLDWLRDELELNNLILKKNFKNYAAFVHRHWIFDSLVAFSTQEAASKEEGSLSIDDKTEHNFRHPHCVLETGSTVKQEAGLRETLEESSLTRAVSLSVDIKCERTPFLDFLLKALEKEKAHCEKLLSLDERNFHAWNHRRWVLAMLQRSCEIKRSAKDAEEYRRKVQESSNLEDCMELFCPSEVSEMAYTKSLICKNFSNYSAWHQRAIILQGALKRHCKDRRLPLFPARQALPSWLAELSSASHKKYEDSLASPPTTLSTQRIIYQLLAHLLHDLELLLQAIYCDPNDQAPWFYLSFLRQVFELFDAFLRDAFNQMKELFLSENVTSDCKYGPLSFNLGSSIVWGMLQSKDGDLEEVIIQATIDFLIEERGFREDDSCYLPYYFLLSTLTRDPSLWQSCNSAGKRHQVKGYIWSILRDIFKADSLGESTPSQDSAPNAREKNTRHRLELEDLRRCLYLLCEKLVQSDPLRKEMYRELQVKGNDANKSFC